MVTTNSFHFSTNSGQGRPIVGSKLFAAGQQKDAADLATVQLMASTDKAAIKTEEVLEKLERYSAGLRFYDQRDEDLNEDKGKVAVTNGVVQGAISCWKYFAEGVMDFDPETKETNSLDIKVHSAPTEYFQLKTLDNGAKQLTYRDDWGSNLEFAIDHRQGTITTFILGER